MIEYRSIGVARYLQMASSMNRYRLNNFVSTGGRLLFTALLLAGCTTNKTTTTTRTATEQLLLSTATDHALQKAGLELFAGRKVFLDATYFDSYDSKYVLGTIRDAISRAGAMLVDGATNSEVIIEARSGALAIDESETFFGIPVITVPIPLAGSVQTPEVAFYKSDQQRSVAKFALLAIVRESRAHAYSSGPMDGKSYDKHYKLFFVSWIRTDLPEKQTSEQKAQQYQTWFPQYDAANLTATNTTARGK
jgi:hypothetical protein